MIDILDGKQNGHFGLKHFQVRLVSRKPRYTLFDQHSDWLGAFWEENFTFVPKVL